MENKPTKLPVWFWIVAILFLLWNTMGLMSFFAHTFISDEAMAAKPVEEQALYAEYPLWTTIVFAIATLFGFLAALGIVLRKKWAKPMTIVSLFAVIPQMIQNVFFTSAVEYYGTLKAVTMPILVVLFAMLILWFADFGKKKAWLK